MADTNREPTPLGLAPVSAAHVRQLGWLLAWAVVFCDIGTSVYYTTGILYHHVGDLAPFFIGMTTLGFLLLAQKYGEVCWRNPEGGGVVTVAHKAFGAWWGALGGILITIDYFLTSSISAVSGFAYLSSVIPALAQHIELLSCAGILLLCLLNIIGIRESATVALVMALASFATSLITGLIGLIQLRPDEMRFLLDSAHRFESISPRQIMIGFAGSWLAFSGLESISQLSPVLRPPLKKTARWALLAVIITVLVTAPILSALSVAVLPAATKQAQTDAFVSDLALARAGSWLQISVVASASALLLFAANTAMIGGYHVFLALSRDRFYPRLLARRSRAFSTPHWAILLTAAVPVGTILLTKAHLSLLGDMYSFGLLGAFTFTSLGLDVLRWRSGARGFVFWVGLFTTLVVGVSWAVNIVEKPFSTAYGVILTSSGLLIALAVRHGWIVAMLNRIPIISRRAEKIRRQLEFEVEDEQEILALAGAVAMKPLYHSSTLLTVLGPNPKLMEEAIRRCKGLGETTLYMLSVTEWPGLLSGAENKPSSAVVSSFAEMGRMAREKGIFAIPIWCISDNAARAMADAVRRLDCSCIMLGVSQRSAVYHMLRGNVLRGLVKYLPEGRTIITVG
jgi:amino acid transporter